jgi:molybdate transport system substrate-binding protein
MKKRIIGIALAIVCVCSVGMMAGCSQQSSQSGEITVMAAASLTDAFNEVGTKFNEKYPNIKVNFSYDSSGTLEKQIEQGATADVFVSAAMKQMNTLTDKSLVDSDSVVKLLENKVVLIKPKGSTLDVSSFQDVATDKVSMVAIGNSDVPVGQYTQKIYTNLGLWDQIQAKANLATNVRQVLDWVATGNAPCGIVYATDAAIEDKVEVVCEAPEGSCDPVIYPMGIVTASTQKDAAKAFTAFLQTKDAQDILTSYGFTIYSDK